MYRGLSPSLAARGSLPYRDWDGSAGRAGERTLSGHISSYRYPYRAQIFAGMAVLGALVTLQDLSVANTAAGDVSLAAWGALTALTRLNLDSTAVTDRWAARALGRGLDGLQGLGKTTNLTDREAV